MKHCKTCDTEKPPSEFNKKGGGYQSKCRECQREWYKNYYNNSSVEKARLFKSNLIKREAIHAVIRKAKSVPCADCQGEYPYFVMDFDHVDPTQKTFTIARFAKYPLEKVLEEIEKCDVVCSNCHRIRTHAHRA